MTATTPEGKVKEKVKKILDEWDVAYFMPNASMYGRGGVSDFICCFEGRFIAIETKSGKKEKPTKLQQRFMNEVLEKGRGVALVIHDENLDILTGILRRISHEEKSL